MGASQPEGSLLWGSLHRLTLSGPPREDSACGFPGSHARPEPPGLQVTQPLSPDPGFYQEIRERGLNTSHESDDDLLDEPSGPDGSGKADAPIVVKSYRPAQVTWSQLPEVGPGRRAEVLSPNPWAVGPSKPAWVPPVWGQAFQKYLLGPACSGELPSCCPPGCPAPRAPWVWVPRGRSMRTTCHRRRSPDKPPAREPLALSLLGLICRNCGPREPFRGACPQESARGSEQSETTGEGRGPGLGFKRATCPCRAAPSPSTPESRGSLPRRAAGAPGRAWLGRRPWCPDRCAGRNPTTPGGQPHS